MSIKPNIRIYQTPVTNGIISIENLPKIIRADYIDADPIDVIHNQPLPNNISTTSVAPLKDDIIDLVKLLGAYCQEDSIEQIKLNIKTIHEKLNKKDKRTIKSWVRKIIGLHPKIDEYIKNNLEYFKNPYSEIIGTNTIMYYADTSSIDITLWSKNPLFTTNEVSWFLDPWPSPSYLRESVREKLASDVVDFIMKSNQILTKHMTRNLIYDAKRTTENGTGREIAQKRPIEYNVAHGSALNNDWYHQQYRILNGQKNKHWCKNDAIFKMSGDGYLVHLLVNYLEPLLVAEVANNKLIEIKVEETFPGSNGKNKANINHNGQIVNDVSKTVNDFSLKPVKIGI